MGQTFSASVKAQICAQKLHNCCGASLLYGMLLFGRRFSQTRIEITTESDETAALAVELCKRYLSLNAELQRHGKLKKRVVLAGEAAQLALEYYGSQQQRGRRINYAVFDNCQDYEELCSCYRAFLAGAFLICGSVAEPTRQYHMEFAVPFQKLAQSLARFLEEVGFAPKTMKRGEHNNLHVLYFKDNERVADLLTLMGANAASLELSQIAIEKNLRNKANRQTNSDTANLNRITTAAARQLNAIRKLEVTGKLSELSPALRAAAELRIVYPQESLTELVMLSGDVTRSSLYSRLKKLEEMV
ncbi:MAG: DNA-binding protein WhiA [Oscillospiraceae bacterium]|nr:DNA-binding protein WhiA [Oscillospiraceae bacterium]